MNHSDDVQMKIRVNKEIHAWLKKAAQQQERSVTWIVNKLIGQVKENQEACGAKQA